LPGSIEAVVVAEIAAASAKREGADFDVVANPEFMREGSALRDFHEPAFVVLGERRPGAADPVAELYRGVSAPQIRTTLGTAETIKFACNAFHAVKVTFANEIGQFAKAHHLDGQVVMDILGRDSKLNISRAYLNPGPAFGGSCLPKDLRALVNRARQQDLELPMLEAVTRSNLLQIQRAIERVTDLGNREVALLGLSFKAGTDDLRESPVVIMAEALLGKGFQLVIHDSELELTRLTGANRQFLEEKLPHINSLLVASLPRAIQSGRTLVVCKNHPDYHHLSQAIGPHHRIVDLVGFLKAESCPPGTYHGLYW
jgi:GDP-mannose 6-dehydrogenase